MSLSFAFAFLLFAACTFAILVMIVVHLLYMVLLVLNSQELLATFLSLCLLAKRILRHGLLGE